MLTCNNLQKWHVDLSFSRKMTCRLIFFLIACWHVIFGIFNMSFFEKLTRSFCKMTCWNRTNMSFRHIFVSFLLFNMQFSFFNMSFFFDPTCHFRTLDFFFLKMTCCTCHFPLFKKKSCMLILVSTGNFTASTCQMVRPELTGPTTPHSQSVVTKTMSWTILMNVLSPLPLQARGYLND